MMKSWPLGLRPMASSMAASSSALPSLIRKGARRGIQPLMLVFAEVLELRLAPAPRNLQVLIASCGAVIR